MPRYLIEEDRQRAEAAEAERDTATRALGEMRAALEFYAREAWEQDGLMAEGGVMDFEVTYRQVRKIDRDHGKRARAALSASLAYRRQVPGMRLPQSRASR